MRYIKTWVPNFIPIQFYLLMFPQLHVTTLSVNQWVLISQRNKKINFGEEINIQCYTCYVCVFVRNVTYVLCSKEDIFLNYVISIDKIYH